MSVSVLKLLFSLSRLRAVFPLHGFDPCAQVKTVQAGGSIWARSVLEEWRYIVYISVEVVRLLVTFVMLVDVTGRLLSSRCSFCLRCLCGDLVFSCGQWNLQLSLSSHASLHEGLHLPVCCHPPPNPCWNYWVIHFFLSVFAFKLGKLNVANNLPVSVGLCNV